MHFKISGYFQYSLVTFCCSKYINLFPNNPKNNCIEEPQLMAIFPCSFIKSHNKLLYKPAPIK